MAAPADEFGDFDIDDDDDLIPLDSYRPFQPAAQSYPARTETTTHRSDQPLPAQYANPSGVQPLEHDGGVLDGDDEYGELELDEEDVVDLDVVEHNAMLNRDPSRLNGSYPHPKAPIRMNGQGNRQYDAMEVEAASKEESEMGTMAARLRAQVEDLERQLNEEKTAAQQASRLAQTKAGEASILRQKDEAASRKHQEQIFHMEQQHADTLANLKLEIESLRKQQDKISTNNLFLENEVLEAAHRAKQSKTKKYATGEKSPFTTPRKGRTALPFRDGFDDDELSMVSPSKFKDRAKPSTPKAGNKRKRMVIDDSPSQPLALSDVQEHPATVAAPAVGEPEPPYPLGIDDEKHDIVQQILNHRQSNSPDRVIEKLADHHLPEDSKRISSLVLDSLLSAAAKSDVAELPSSLCRSLAVIWSTVLKAKCFGPVHLLMDLVHFSFRLSLMTVPINVSLDILEVVMTSIDLVAIPIGRAATNEAFPRTADERHLEEFINVESCLSLLLSIASLYAGDAIMAQKFWSGMTYDFILLMLMTAQPMPQILLMLRLLQASVLPSSFGAVSLGDAKSGERQTRSENSTIDRLINLLLQTPHADKQRVPQCSRLDVVNLRVETLGVLMAIASTDHGAQRLANHRTAIGRLFIFLFDSMNELHRSRPRTQSATANAINLTVRILFVVIDKYRDTIDMRQKLSVVNGGTHVHLVALTRLTFSERLVLDEGIDPDVIESARSLLSTYVTYDEGTAIEAIYAPPASGARTINTDSLDP